MVHPKDHHRVHRIGSEIHDSIVITDYVTEGTIEERVIQVLETKADNFEQIVRDKDQLLKLLQDDKAGKLWVKSLDFQTQSYKHSKIVADVGG